MACWSENVHVPVTTVQPSRRIFDLQVRTATGSNLQFWLQTGSGIDLVRTVGGGVSNLWVLAVGLALAILEPALGIEVAVDVLTLAAA